MRREVKALALGLWLVAGCTKSTEDPMRDAATQDAAMQDAAMQDATMQDAMAADSGVPWMQAVGVLVPDEACLFDPRESAFLLKGSYDTRDLPGCRSSYYLTLLVESHVPAVGLPDGAVGISGDITQITEATVTLLDASDTTIPTGVGLPNPFRVTTRATIPPMQDGMPGVGVVEVEVIPLAFRAVLRTLAQSQATIVAEITLTASTIGGETVHIDPFRYPIQLCEGCLSHCASELTPEEIDALTQGQCPDNAGANNRACIDQGC